MGPLKGLKIIEVGGIGPSQFCGMLLADMGADILRIERPDQPGQGVAIPAQFNLMNRSRKPVAIDIKTQAGRDLVLRLCEDADALFEGFRPGVMERLGLGPDDCMARNTRLVYGRMTGWGQDGPLAGAVGHDTNYIALSGALNSIGHADRPPPLPLNLVGDFGGGGIYLAMGMLAAMLETTRSGQGQVVDAAMVDGAASMMTLFYGLLAGGLWQDKRHSNLLDGGAPFANTYETSDGKYVAVCAIEHHFYRALLEGLSIDEIDPASQYDFTQWPEHKKVFAEKFRSRTRDEWNELLLGTDACFAPVLSMTEAPQHPHNEARGTFTTVDGVTQPAPAPRFSRTKSEIRSGPKNAGNDTKQTLAAWGLDEAAIAEYLAADGSSESS
jgi:alpha-methylacyl-CoA racemase